MATALLCSFLSSAWMLWAYLLIYDRKHNNFQQSKSISFNLIVKKQLRSILAQLNENKFVIERAFKNIDKNLYPNFQQFRYHSFDGRTASLIFQLGYAHFSAQLEFNELIFEYIYMNTLLRSKLCKPHHATTSSFPIIRDQSFGYSELAMLRFAYFSHNL